MISDRSPPCAIATGRRQNWNAAAKVQRLGAKVDPVSQSVKLSAAIDGRLPELVAGMSGKVLMAPEGRQ